MDGSYPIDGLRTPGADAVTQAVARIVEVGDDGLQLAVGARRVRGRRATSCVVEPAPGDTVLVAETDAGAFVLAILARSVDIPAVISVPDTPEATLAQDRLSVRCDELTVDATSTTVRSRIARVAGRTLNAVAERLDVVARTLRRSADHDFSHARTATRTVEGAETVTAGELMLEARTALAQRGHIVLVDAREDVRINGERITMG